MSESTIDLLFINLLGYEMNAPILYASDTFPPPALFSLRNGGLPHEGKQWDAVLIRRRNKAGVGGGGGWSW